MTASIATTKLLRSVLVFGPQALSFDSAAFPSLSSQLQRHEYVWLLDAISSLPDDWESLSHSSPIFRRIPGHSLIQTLSSALRTGIIPDSLFPIPNFLLSPLVVLRQLLQYQTFLETSITYSLEGDHTKIVLQDTEILGLCTGSLAAFAISCAATHLHLRKYGAAAIRIAMAIGALVDAEDLGPDTDGPCGSISVSWSATDSNSTADEVLRSFPDAYISVRVDLRRVTVTAPRLTLPVLVHKLKATGLYVTDVKLSGRFHWPKRQEHVDELIRFCNNNVRFQLPDASQMLLPSRSETDGQYIITGSLHQIAIRSILLDKSNWTKVFDPYQSSQQETSNLSFTCFGSERCLPPTLAHKLGSSLLYVPDPGIVTPSRSSTPLLAAYTPLELQDVPDHRIAVVGMSCHTAGAKDLNEYWDVLLSGQSQHTEVPTERFDMATPWRPLDPDRKWYGNFLRDHDKFDHKFFKRSPREMASTDPQQRLAMKLAYQAVEQSGYYVSDLDDKHIACYIGIGNNDYERNIACHAANAYSAKGNLRSFIAGNISHYFGWTGPSMTIDSACSSSSVAIHNACRSIIAGECTAALAGGVNVFTNPDWFHNLAGASFLSPTGQCKPFDAQADGYCRGEGVGFVFLKSLSKALADGDQVFGVVASTRVYQNQSCTAITVPNASSLSTLFTDVVREAKLEPRSITVVEAHGTGTPVGDPAEYDAIRTALTTPTRATPLHLSSVKGSIGHCEFSSGVLSLLKVLLMISERTIPPQASFSTINHSLKAIAEDKMEIPIRKKTWDVNFRAALINNYGASGSNASMIVTQPPRGDISDATIPHKTAQAYPFWFCGLDDKAIKAYSTRLRQFLQRGDSTARDMSARNLSFQVYRQSNRSLPQSLIVHAKTSSDLAQQLASFEAGNENNKSTRVPSSRPVILCFGGQSSTYVGLDKDVYDNIVLFRKHLDECDAVCVSLGLESILPGIFQRSNIEDVVQLQSMLFAMQYSCAMTWIDCGVEVAAIIGHSFGELVGLCIAGAYSLRNALRLVSSRAKIVRRCWNHEKGSMLAIEADLDNVETLLAQACTISGGEEALSIACYNGARTFTIAGTKRMIDLTEDLIHQDCIPGKPRSKRLNVTNAYHSALVDPLQNELEVLGQSVVFKEPHTRVERATKYSSRSLGANFIAKHMRDPVFFSHAAQRLHEDFPSAIWLEAGSNSTVTTMASRALGAMSSGHFQTVNLSDSGSLDRLVHVTKTLWKEGLNVSFWAHHRSQVADYVPLFLPPYQFEESEHWMDLQPVPHVLTSDTDRVSDIRSGLTSFVGYKDHDKRSVRFQVNTSMEAFQQKVAATLVVNTAGVPSSMLQLDIIVDAFTLLRPELKDFKLKPEFRNILHKSILSIEAAKDLYLDAATSDSDRLVWQWRLNVRGPTGETIDITTGTIALWSVDIAQSMEEFDNLQRFVSIKRCTELLADQNADEVLQGRSIYQSFKPVVDWRDPYRHVTRIAGKGTETAGRVKKTFDGMGSIDSVLTESFCQIASCYINLVAQSPGRVFMCSKIQRVLRSPRLDALALLPDVWEVFVIQNQQSDTTYISDIFAFDPLSGSLIEAVLGVTYQQMSVEGLKRALSGPPGAAEPRPDMVPPVVVGHEILSTADMHPIAPTGDMGQVQSSYTGHASPKTCIVPEPNVSERAREILCNLSGLEPGEIQDDSDLIELGIDSLMAMEVVREVDLAFRCTLSNEQLMDLTDFQSLVTCICSALGLGPEVHGDGLIGDKMPAVNDQALSYGCDGTSVTTEHAIDQCTPMVLLKELRNIEEAANTDSTHTTGELDRANDCSNDTNSIESLKNTVGHSEINPLSMVKTSPYLSETTLLSTFRKLKWTTDDFIIQQDLDGYSSRTVPRLTELCVIYIVEAFEQLGCSIQSAVPGQRLKHVSHHSKHKQFVDLLYHLLEHEARLIEIKGAGIIRTSTILPQRSASVLLAELIRDEPVHIAECKLVALLGPKLAWCLMGQVEGVQVLFSEGREMLADLYTSSPFSRTWTSQLESFIRQIVEQLPSTTEPLCVLEVGAGTGGTTNRLAQMLAGLGRPVYYTMTDVSASLVAAARRRFKQYPFMNFKVLDIESEPDTSLLSSQHIVLSTNCIHATRNLSNSVINIRRMLRPDGFLILLEMTRQLPWVDFVFGPIEGWWLFEDGRDYVLSSATEWESTLHSAGYGHVDWTDGDLPEADIQRLIIAHASGPKYDRGRRPIPIPTPSSPFSADSYERQAMIDAYVQKYTDGWAVRLERKVSNTRTPSERCVLVTGATGSLGSHVVAELAQRSDINTVICLNRLSHQDATLRQYKSLESKGIRLASAYAAKLKVMAADTSKPMLGLSKDAYDFLTHTVTDIVHSAWPMSLTRPVRGYEIQFKVMRNLLNLAQEAADLRPAPFKFGFQFVSSIAVVGSYPEWAGKALVPEQLTVIDTVPRGGYAEAKFSCENMLHQTLYQYPDRFQSMAVRIAQISGSATSGHWNPTEYIPILAKSSRNLQVLPDLDGTFSWCAVDRVAATLGDLLTSTTATDFIYHVDNPSRQSWKHLIAMFARLLDIPSANIVPFAQWIRRVQQSEGSTQDNPALQLIDFFNIHFVPMSCGGLILDVERTARLSTTLRTMQAIDDDLLVKYVEVWKRSGFL